jgi:anti-anti-sigma factor
MISVTHGEELEITITTDIIDKRNSIELLDLINREAKYQKKNIRLDLGRVRIIDSSGIAMLIGFYQRHTNVHRTITISSVSDEVRRIFGMLNIEHFLNVV